MTGTASLAIFYADRFDADILQGNALKGCGGKYERPATISGPWMAGRRSMKNSGVQGMRDSIDHRYRPVRAGSCRCVATLSLAEFGCLRLTNLYHLALLS